MDEERFFAMLLNTMREARRNKRYGKDCSDFEMNWAPLLVRMMRRLQAREFRVNKNYAFLTSVPKWREIFATFFEGRIADHLLCDTLAPYIARELHPRTFNNRPGMGSQAAINQVIEDIYVVSNGYAEPCRIIKWDLKGYFPNAVNDEVEKGFVRLIEKYRPELARDYDEEFPNFLRWLAMVCVHSCPAKHCELRTPKHFWPEHIVPEKSLFGKPDGIGAPIGRLPSQIGMGLYLNPEVEWLNEECGIRATLFMDDCVEIVPERLHGYALSLMPELRKRLSAKGIRLNEKKFYDQPYFHGLEFLGSHIEIGRVHVNNCTVGRAMHRIEEFNTMPDKRIYIDNVLSSINSYTGLLKARTDRKRLECLISMVGDYWKNIFDWDKERLCYICKQNYAIRERLSAKYHLKTNHHDKARNSRPKESGAKADFRSGSVPFAN